MLDIMRTYKIIDAKQVGKIDSGAQKRVGRTLEFLYTPLIGFDMVAHYLKDSDGSEMVEKYMHSTPIESYKANKDGTVTITTRNTAYVFKEVSDSE